jgi:hypothetical protein
MASKDNKRMCANDHREEEEAEESTMMSKKQWMSGDSSSSSPSSTDEFSSEEESIRWARFDDGDTTDSIGNDGDNFDNGSDDQFSDEAFN